LLSSSSRLARYLGVLLLVPVLFGLAYTNYRFSLRSPGGNDFLARWTGAHAWLRLGLSPYDPEVSLMAQQMIYGRPADPQAGEDAAHFVYPFPSIVLFAPFGLLPYTEARAVWMLALEIGLPALVWAGTRLAKWRPGPSLMAFLMLFSILWYHGVRSIILGQFAVLEALLLALALLAIQGKQDALAGILLSLSIAKPQMSYMLVPFIVLWAVSVRRWRLVFWTIGSLVVLLAVSIAILPEWPLRWLQQTVAYREYSPTITPISVLAGLVAPAQRWVEWGLTGLLILYLLIEWAQALGKDDPWFQWSAAMTLVVASLVSSRTATTNYVMMIPGLCLVFGVWVNRWGRKGSWATVVTLILLLVGLWGLFIATVDGSRESPLMYLPLPLLLLAGLLWIRWWKLRASSLPS